MELKKELSFIDVYCIASGAMISAGIFILPGIAFSHTGPSVVVSYFLAGLSALIGILSVAELSTAMPKAGGDYYFITRSLGPLVGTISGFLSWFALSLKSAFAIFGIAEILFLLTGLNIRFLSISVCLFIVILNIIGIKKAAKLEVVLVVGLLISIGIYVFGGVFNIDISNFKPFMPDGVNAVFSTSALVFISFGGLLNVASVSEEVKNPKRNIPAGLIAAAITVTCVYVSMVFVTVGSLAPDKLSSSITPIADAARGFMGKPGCIAITLAALLAFITTANSGIMSASRYPFALSRDKLFFRFVSRVNGRFKTPDISILLTGLFISLSLIVELELLVKAASSVILSSYILSNISIIILRESKLKNYRPSFKAPLYPWIQILGIIIFLFFIIDLGFEAVEASLIFVLVSLGIYFFYGRKKVKQEYALLHLVEGITDKKLTYHNLETELRDILRERDNIISDKFDRLVENAGILDLEGPIELNKFFELISLAISAKSSINKAELVALFKAREESSSTALSSFLAIPHIVVKGSTMLNLTIVRCKKGIRFSKIHNSIKAVFILIGTADERLFHLWILVAIAQLINEKGFETKWVNAEDIHYLRDLILLSNRQRLLNGTEARGDLEI